MNDGFFLTGRVGYQCCSVLDFLREPWLAGWPGSVPVLNFSSCFIESMSGAVLKTVFYIYRTPGFEPVQNKISSSVQVQVPVSVRRLLPDSKPISVLARVNQPP